jgi:hypothetical protein
MHSPTVKNYTSSPLKALFTRVRIISKPFDRRAPCVVELLLPFFLCLKHERGPCSKQSLSASVEL